MAGSLINSPRDSIRLGRVCPNCGSLQVRSLPNNVHFEYQGETVVLRNRLCRECENTWHTLEIRVQMTSKLHAYTKEARRLRAERYNQ